MARSASGRGVGEIVECRPFGDGEHGDADARAEQPVHLSIAARRLEEGAARGVVAGAAVLMFTAPSR